MKETVAIFVHDPVCEVECALAMEAALKHKFEVKLFGIEDLTTYFLSTVDIVAFPGGIGDSDQFNEIFDQHDIDTVRDYVQNGGKYLGICMGAYWAGSYYFDILHGIEPVQYISQLDADILTDGPTLARVDWNGQEEDMYFYDGCAFVGNLAFTDIIATYGNGDAMAVYQNQVGLLGCHPESEEWWYELDELEGWHEGRHNELFCEFVEGL
jgi:glutamine amidotransferase-like uncharacterized protein